jgi:hypothetical protein
LIRGGSHRRKVSCPGDTAARREFGETKIKNLGLPVRRDENVGGLDGAMNDAFGVSGVERIGDLNSQIQHQLYRHGLSADPTLERLTVEELHGQERPIILLPNFMNCADVEMIESRSGAGFAPEAFECLRVIREFVRQKFQCDMTPETEIFGLVNNTHPTAADFFQNAVVRDGLANHECRRNSRWPYVRVLLNASQSLMVFKAKAIVLDELSAIRN